MKNSNTVKSVIKNFCGGAVIGGSMLVPGVSGGTSAIIIGIYDKLVKAVSELFSDFKRNALFLLIVAAGGGMGAILFSGVILNIVSRFYVPSMYFFVGAILGSVPLMIRKADISMKNIGCVLFAAVGAAAAIGVGLLPNFASVSEGSMLFEIMMQILCGIMIAIALILPGISTSHMLLVLGMYEPILNAVKNVDILSILPVCIGILAGLFACTKILGTAMKRFPSQTFMMITGFVFVSVYDIFPGAAANWEMVLCIILSLLGFFAVFLLGNGKIVSGGTDYEKSKSLSN